MLEEFFSPIEISIQVSVAAGIIAVLLGTAAARLLANRNFKGKSVIETGKNNRCLKYVFYQASDHALPSEDHD